MSARLARRKGFFPSYPGNEIPFAEVVGKHRERLSTINAAFVPSVVLETARLAWESAEALGERHGYRNSQVTLLAPTGTTAFMMDCDTTGIEPDIALVKYKKLVGDGVMKIVNMTVSEALNRLGYASEQVVNILEYLERKETIEGAPGFRDDHLPVFDCAFAPKNGTRSIHYKGHIHMMAACQPFLSGAISKTVNLPEDVQVEEIERVFIEAWKLGLKAVTVYRENCKRVQPLNVSKEAERKKVDPIRERLPKTRQSLTHKFSISGHEGYITAGMYEDGRLGEIFITMAKQGSTISGLVDAFATSTSIALQYGVPFKDLVRKFTYMRFEPSGYTGNEEVPRANSIIDYIFRWLAVKFLPPEDCDFLVKTNGNGHDLAKNAGDSNGDTAELKVVEQEVQPTLTSTVKVATDAPLCNLCGTIMIRSGTCHSCPNCANTGGCS